MSARRLAPGFAALALLSASDASAWCRTTTSTATPSSPTACITEGIPLAWARRCQTYSVDSRAGGGLSLAEMRAAVNDSFSTWNAVECSAGSVFDLSEGPQVLCDHAEYSTDDENSNAIAFAADFDARMYPDDAIAITIVWHNRSSGEILDADMMINTRLGPFVNCPASGCPAGTTQFDLQNVVTHEAGHFLGLAHSADEDATMYYRADPAETSKRSLDVDDVMGLCAAYGDASVPAECDPTPRHGFDPDCSGEETNAGEDDGCGCTVVGSGDRPSVLVLGVVALLLSRLRRRSRGS